MQRDPRLQPSGSVAPVPRIVLVAPSFDPRGTPAQDLELEILLGYLRRSWDAVRIIDAQLARLSPEALAGRLSEAKADLIYWQVCARAAYRALKLVVAHLPAHREQRPLMLAGGDFASRHDEAILGSVPQLDGVIRGETERPLEAIVRRMANGEPLVQAESLSFRGALGVVRNRPSALLEDLGELPRAEADLFVEDRRGRGQDVLFSRGCNSNCTYCGLQTPYRQDYSPREKFWRGRPARAIVDEIEYYHREHEVTKFSFNSYVFFGHDDSGSEQVRAVAEEMIRRKLQVAFTLVTHPAPVARNRQILALLKEAGLALLTLGIDTGLDRVFSLYQLEFGRRHIVEALATLHELEIPFRPSFVLYDPYLRPDELLSNLRFIRGLEPYFGHMKMPFGAFLDQCFLHTVLRVHASTPLYAQLKKDGLADEADPLERDPAVRFLHPDTGRVFRLHQRANQAILRKTRLFTWSAKAVSQFPFLNGFPCAFLEKIVELVTAPEEFDEDRAFDGILDWTRRQLSPNLQEMLELLGASAEDRKAYEVLRC